MEHRFTPIVIALVAGVLALSQAVNLAMAQGPKDGPKAVAALGTAFTYQGQLKSSGSLVNGSCYLQFRLYSDAGGTALVAGPVNGSPNPVTVTNGLFTVQIDFGSAAFQGDPRWMQTSVKCGSDSAYTPLSLEPVAPTPYAQFSARTSWGPIMTGNGNGLTAQSNDISGVGLEGVHTTTNNFGDLGKSSTGVFGAGLGTGSDGVDGSSFNGGNGVAGTAFNGGNGVVGTAYTGGYAVLSQGNMKVTGNLQVDGQATGFFPRPAWDSGWVQMTASCLWLNHWVGGNADNYVVDLQGRQDTGTITDYGIGGFFYSNTEEGTWYDNLNNYQIEICRKVVTTVNYLRVRIWVYT